MKLIIDIDEKIGEYIKDYIPIGAGNNVFCYPDEIVRMIQNGIPIPKGHGRLIDVDNIQYIQLEDSLTVLTHTKGDEVDWYIDAPTIIEADKAESEEQTE